MLARCGYILLLLFLLGGCGRWAMDGQDERAAELIDASLPAGMTLQEFGQAFPAAERVDGGDDGAARAGRIRSR